MGNRFCRSSRSNSNDEEETDQIQMIKKNRSTRLISNTTEIGKFSGNEYLFGDYYFFYTPEFKSEGHYVEPTYECMEEEVIKNKSCSIRKTIYNRTKEAVKIIREKMIKSCKNTGETQEECFHKFGIRLYARDHEYYNNRFNIKAGQEISLQHLIAVKLYFDNTSFPSALRQTYWCQDTNETLADIKARHANFAHVSRALCEAIYLYGNELAKDKCVFRGITQRTFAWFNATFAGPVSTTESIAVAHSFAGSGSVIQLKSGENNNMYICGSAEECNLSNHMDEKECLMWSPCLHITDILYSLYKPRYVKPYISAMRLFQKIVTGHPLSPDEKKELLDDNIQNTLNALIEWRITCDDEELIEFVNQEETQRRKEIISSKMKQELSVPISKSSTPIKSSRSRPRPVSSRNTGNTMGCLDIISSESRCILSPKSLQTKAKFIKSLCGTVFENLSEKTQFFWLNSDVTLNANLKHSIQTLLTQMEGCLLKCETFKWKVFVQDLEMGPSINEKYSVIDEYLTKEIIDKNLLKTFLDCDKVMNLIREYFDIRYVIDAVANWKCDVIYKNEMYAITPTLLLCPTSTRPDNKWYDIGVIITDMDGIKDVKSLKWSFDILCDELDICLHFVDKDIERYSNRKHTQIISNDDIRNLVNDKKDIVWQIVFRFHH